MKNKKKRDVNNIDESNVEAVDFEFTYDDEDNFEFYGLIDKDRGYPRYCRYEIGPIEIIFEELCSNSKVPECEILLQECKKRVRGYEDYYNLDYTPVPVISELEQAVLHLYPYFVRRYSLLALFELEREVQIIDCGKNFLSEAMRIQMKYKGKTHHIAIYDEDSYGFFDRNMLSNKNDFIGTIIQWDKSPVHRTMLEFAFLYEDFSIDDSSSNDSIDGIKKPDDLTEMIFLQSDLTSYIGNIKVYDRRHFDFIISCMEHH